jgi:hypothetical protein
LEEATAAENTSVVRYLGSEKFYWYGTYEVTTNQIRSAKRNAALLAISHDDFETLAGVWSMNEPDPAATYSYLCSEACYKGKLKCFEWIASRRGLQFPPLGEEVYPYRTTARHNCALLYCAIAEGHVEIVDRIIREGNSLQQGSSDSPDLIWKQSVQTAIVNRQLAVLQTLIGNQLFSRHMLSKYHDLSRRLLKSFFLVYGGRDDPGYNYDPPWDEFAAIPDRHGCSLLMYASYHGLINVVDAILRSRRLSQEDVGWIGFCPLGVREIPTDHIPTAHRVSALVLATIRGHKAVLQALLNFGAYHQIDEVDISNRTDVNIVGWARTSYDRLEELAGDLGHDDIRMILERKRDGSVLLI